MRVDDGAPQAARPVAPTDRIELRLALSALRVVAVLAVPLCAAAWLVAGSAGLRGAGLGAAVVGGMFALSGVLLSWAAPFGPSAMMAAALGGYVARLLVYALLVVGLRGHQALHGPSLAITAALLLVVTLVLQARTVSRRPDLWWVDAAAARDVVQPRRPAAEAAGVSPRSTSTAEGPMQ